jgi:hypothetical protein
MDSFNRIRPAWRHVIKVALMCYFATVNRHRENSIILVLVFEQQRRKVTKEEKTAINACSTPLFAWFAWFAVIPSSHQPPGSRREMEKQFPRLGNITASDSHWFRGSMRNRNRQQCHYQPEP